MHVVLIDDDEYDVENVRRALQPVGHTDDAGEGAAHRTDYAVSAFPDGVEAIAALFP